MTGRHWLSFDQYEFTMLDNSGAKLDRQVDNRGNPTVTFAAIEYGEPGTSITGDAETGFTITNTHQMKAPETVDYTEHYRYEEEKLLQEMLDIIPTRADRYPDGSTVIPADPSVKEVPGERGK